MELPTGAQRTWTTSLSKAGVREAAGCPNQHFMLPAGYHLRNLTTPMRSCTLRAGTRKVRGFATGQGRGWPWSKTPSCRRLRPGGANGKRRYEEPAEILNITSRCVRSGNRRRSRRPVTQCCVMLCSGFPAQTVVRSTDAARAFTFPWGTEGDKVEVTAAQGRLWPEPSLLCADGWCCDAKPRAATQLRAAVQRGLDRFPVMVGKGALAIGWGYTIAGRRLARCRAIPLSSGGWSRKRG